MKELYFEENFELFKESQENFGLVKIARENLSQEWRAKTLSALTGEIWAFEKNVLDGQRSLTGVELR